MPKAVEFWAKSPNDNVLLYDTTFSTNRCGMKLGCGTGVNEEGLSNILFVSLVSYQDSDAFQWVFEEMMKAFHTAAAVIFTDSDPAMAIAIVTVLAPNGTKHFLCTWHLSKNFVTNMKGTAGTAWRDIEGKWWRIWKETPFDAEWEELTSLLPSVDPSNQAATKTRDNSLKWLDSLKDKKEKWAARWTWATFTAGVHSTQRSEIVHAAIKRFLGATTLLTQLAESLVLHSDDIDQKAAEKAARAALTATSRSMSSDSSFVASQVSKLSTFALSTLRAQQAQMIFTVWKDLISRGSYQFGLRNMLFKRLS